jgi:hypothetical protein
VLDAFGGRAQAEQAAKLDGALQEFEALRCLAHRVDEALVDLDDVHGKAQQPLERRTAGAVVVEGNPGAEVAQRRQQRLGSACVAGERALGQLEHESAGGQRRRSAQRDGYGVEEAGIQELLWGEVDAHIETVVDHSGCSPSTQLGGRLADRPATNGEDEPGGLEQLDELAGPDEPAQRVAPAEQGLGPGRRAADGIDNGLVVQLELVAGKRTLELFERRRGLVDLRGRAVFCDRRVAHVDFPPSRCSGRAVIGMLVEGCFGGLSPALTVEVREVLVQEIAGFARARRGRGSRLFLEVIC